MNLEEKKIIEFIEQYNVFNKWLLSIGFKSIPSNTTLDYHYSSYDKYVDSLHGVEHYSHSILETDIRFLRDRNEHKFLLVDCGEILETYNISEFKEFIVNVLSEIKNEKLEELNRINITL